MTVEEGRDKGVYLAERGAAGPAAVVMIGGGRVLCADWKEGFI